MTYKYFHEFFSKWIR